MIWSGRPKQAHPGLRRGCGAAFSIESETGERVVLVYEIEKKLPESDMSEVMSCIRRALADEYELEVHTVVLIKSGTIPRTSSGKIQRHACKADFESGQTRRGWGEYAGRRPRKRRTVGLLSETPHTRSKKGWPISGRRCWEDLRHDAMRTSSALGGNSLLAAQVVARILDVFHVELPLSVAVRMSDIFRAGHSCQ